MTIRALSPPSIDALQAALADQLRDDVDQLTFADRYADDLQGWHADLSRCHDNVDRWLLAHPGDQPVRGWLLECQLGTSYRLAAHSMVRTQKGELLDVTLPRSECQRPFIAHPVSVGGFFALLCSNPPHHEVTVHLGGSTPTKLPIFEKPPND